MDICAGGIERCLFNISNGCLAEYCMNASSLRSVLIVVVSPVPCLVVTTLVDIFPLAKPSDGIVANKLFWIRQLLTYFVLNVLAILQFRVCVPRIIIPIRLVLVIATTSATITVSIICALAGAVGFPLPFSIVAVSPLWFVVTTILITWTWMKSIRTNCILRKMVVDTLKLWMSYILMAMVYPVYFYIFTLLSSSSQIVFALLLPVMKTYMGNLLGRIDRQAANLRDDAPEIVVFSSEFYNALFVSYCMQKSPSVWTTAVLMLIDILVTSMALRELKHAYRELIEIRERIEKVWYVHPTRLPIMEFLHVLLDTNIQTSYQASTYPTTISIMPAKYGEHWENPQPSNMKSVEVARSFRALRIFDKRNKAYPETQITPVNGNSPRIRIPLPNQCIYKMQKILYVVQFLLFVNYVEVIITLVYSVYLIATYQLPNRDYYTVFSGMHHNQLTQTLSSVMLYFILQLTSLLCLMGLLGHMLKLSPTRLLAFSLEKRVVWVQTSLVFWLFYNVQTTLQHAGYDYSFKFAWLRTAN